MFQFEGNTLDIGRNSLQIGDREVALRRKSFELLRYLVENPDRLVTKEELLKAIWPNVVVTDESLTKCVSEVRQAIADSSQTIIATVPGRGYRFVATVSRIATSGAAAPPAPYAAPSPLVGEGRGGGASAFNKHVPHGSTPTPSPSPQGGGELGRVGESQSPLLDRPSVAVLPFANL